MERQHSKIRNRLQKHFQARHQQFLDLMHPFYGLSTPPKPLTVKYRPLLMEGAIAGPYLYLQIPYNGCNSEDMDRHFTTTQKYKQEIREKEVILGHESSHHLQIRANKAFDHRKNSTARKIYNRETVKSETRWLLGEIVAELGALLFLDKVIGIDRAILDKNGNSHFLYGAIRERYKTYSGIEESQEHLIQISKLTPRNARFNKEFQSIRKLVENKQSTQQSHS